MATGLNVHTWSTTAADNDDADTSVNWVEGQDPGSVNGSARGMMAAIARWRKDFGGAIVAGGTATALTAVTNELMESSHIANGLLLVVRTGSAATGAATIAVDGLSAVAIKKNDGSAIASGDWASGSILVLVYSSTASAFIAANLGTIALLNAIGALTPTDSNIIVGNGTTWVAESGATARTSLGLAIGTNVQAYDADLTTLGAGGAGARSFLGLAIGTDVQAYDADLTTLGAGGAGARSFLGLTIGTSGATVPLLDGSNTWSGNQVFNTFTHFETDGSDVAANRTMRVERIDGSPPSGTELIDFYIAGVQAGSITWSVGGVAYNTTSDYRLKENKRALENVAAVIDAISPCRFDWKATGESGVGFIAHELQAVVPEAVTGEKDAINEDGTIHPQGVDAAKLIPYIVGEVQSIRKRLRMLESNDEKI